MFNDLLFLFNMIKPRIPPIVEAMKMPSLACTSCSGSSKAKLVTKSDMVKPIDANNPIPNNCLLVTPDGKLAQFSFIISLEIPKTPIAFPAIKPATTPSVTLLVVSAKTASEKVTPAFAKAKTGITRKLTKGCILCSSRCKESTGIVKATRTAAIVA